jgi:regulator of sigma E protease
LRLLPILGYVRMAGMEADDLNEPDGFHTKSPWQRILILVAGPAANFLLAMVLIAGFSLTQLNSDPGKVSTVEAGSTAARTGLVVGDRITDVNGKPLPNRNFIREQEDATRGMPLTLSGVHADGKPFSYILAPTYDPNLKHWQIGIGLLRVITVQSAITDGITFPVTVIGGLVQGLWGLITGAIPGGLFGQNGLTGPIGIGAVTVGAVSQGPLTYIGLVALLSVALGFTNLLPLLALDGGRVAVVLIEVLRRRPFDRTMELNFQRWGLVALLAFAAVISFLDVQRITSGQFPGTH